MLLAILVNPSLVAEKRSPLRDVAVVVVDESPSQEIGNRRQATEAALTALKERLGHEPDLDLRVIRAGKPQPGSGDDGTKLFTALNRTMSDIPRQRLAAIIMITDGQVHDVPAGSPAAVAKELGAPLHVLLSGHPGERDRRLVVHQAPSFGLVGKEVPLTIRVEDLPEPKSSSPGAPERQAHLTWRKDGGAPHPLMVPVGRDVKLAIPIDHGGPNVLEFEVEPGPHELTLVNNRAVVVVNGVRDRLRVLLVSGEPHAGERVWRNILKSDPSVDLVHFTILRPPEKQDGTPIRELSLIAFPIRELFDVKLDDFDLIIFDRYSRRGIIPQAYIENVVRYVRNGGAFLEAAGPSFGTPMSLFRTPLGEILPTEPTGNVDEEGFKPQLTDARPAPPGDRGPAGRRQAGRGAELGPLVPPGRGARPSRHHADERRSRRAAPGSRPGRQGPGGAAALGPDVAVGARLRGRRAAGRAVAPARLLADEGARSRGERSARVDRGRPLMVTRQSLEPDDRPVTVTAPDGTSTSLALTPDKGGRSTGSLAIAQMGLYRVSDGTPYRARRGRPAQSRRVRRCPHHRRQARPGGAGQRRRGVLGRRPERCRKFAGCRRAAPRRATTGWGFVKTAIIW